MGNGDKGTKVCWLRVHLQTSSGPVQEVRWGDGRAGETRGLSSSVRLSGAGRLRRLWLKHVVSTASEIFYLPRAKPAAVAAMGLKGVVVTLEPLLSRTHAGDQDI